MARASTHPRSCGLKHRGFGRRFALLLMPLLVVGCAWGSSSETRTGDRAVPDPDASENVTFYPTYGYLEDDEWVVPVRYWVWEDRGLVSRVVTRVASSMAGLEPQQVETFRHRLRPFSGDSEWRQRVTFVFEDDPLGQEYQVLDERGRAPRTDRNGVVEGKVRIPAQRAEELLAAQGSQGGWLRWEAVSRDHSGTGQAILVPSEGTSVISDIDDTIRITEIPAGWSVAVRNTFFDEFREAPGMPELYQEWDGEGDVLFHYVSGTPWQMYESLSEFLFHEETGYPEGTMHFRTVRKNLVSISTWRDLRSLVSAGAETADRKYEVIAGMMEDFPDRTFRLVGDTGEGDPEIYRSLARRFPGQVEEIVIRDITDDRTLRPERLEGMTVIPAETIERATGPDAIVADLRWQPQSVRVLW
ncbi:MAG: DUF2183 domain-containing protein [Gemmatimonadales bacterium]|nr:MAG: DUF2183 domain-containing protein [Gemmatimonadales bacterium]